MRRSVASAFIVAALVLVAGVSQAKTTTKVVHHRAWGTVTGVNAQAMTFTVKTAKKNETFTMNASTMFRDAGKAATSSAVEVGKRVRVTYVVEKGSSVASAVSIMAPRPAKKKTGMKKH